MWCPVCLFLSKCGMSWQSRAVVLELVNLFSLGNSSYSGWVCVLMKDPKLGPAPSVLVSERMEQSASLTTQAMSSTSICYYPWDQKSHRVLNLEPLSKASPVYKEEGSHTQGELVDPNLLSQAPHPVVLRAFTPKTGRLRLAQGIPTKKRDKSVSRGCLEENEMENCKSFS